jgi:hypothetical protein
LEGVFELSYPIAPVVVVAMTIEALENLVEGVRCCMITSADRTENILLGRTRPLNRHDDAQMAAPRDMVSTRRLIWRARGPTEYTRRLADARSPALKGR